MASIPPLLLIGAGLICLGVLIHIIGLGAPHWEEVDARGAHASIGLFKSCYDDKCDKIEHPSSDRKSVQAMTVIGMLCGLLGGAAAGVFVLFNLLSKSPPKILTMVSSAACCVAFVFIIIGVIIYGDKIYDSDIRDLGYSFGLCIVGSIMLAVGGVLVHVGGKSVG